MFETHVVLLPVRLPGCFCHQKDSSKSACAAFPLSGQTCGQNAPGKKSDRGENVLHARESICDCVAEEGGPKVAGVSLRCLACQMRQCMTRRTFI